MPCYTEPASNNEKLERRLNDFLDEIGERTPKTEYIFVGPGKGRKQSIEGMSQILCNHLKAQHPNVIKSYSLELQIWWRDHQRDDARHEREDAEKRRRGALRKSALAKLTVEERKALTGKD